MPGRSHVAACCLVVLLTASLVGAVDYNGYLVVNDEDYGYWEAQVAIWIGGDRVLLDDHTSPIDEPLVLEISHDLAQGLVRQFTPRAQAPNSSSMTGMSDEVSGVATGRREVAPPRGDGMWVFLADFPSFGFGQYQGQLTTAGVYCSDNAKVWAWLSGPKLEGASPDDAADLLIIDENEMAQLKVGCDSTITVEHE